MLKWIGREFWVALRGDFMKCVRYCDRQIGDADRKQRQELGLAERGQKPRAFPKNKVWN